MDSRGGSSLPVVIPAAGHGTRVAELTRGRSKEMLPVAGRPVIDHVLDEAEAAGTALVVVVSRPDKHDLNDHLARVVRSRRLSLELRIEHQGPGEGNGVAILDAAATLPPGPFVVVWGDELFPAHARLPRLAHQHARSGRPCVALVSVDDADVPRCGIVEGDWEGEVLRVRRLLEKPDPSAIESRLASVGGYLLTDSVLAELRTLQGLGSDDLSLALALDRSCRRDPLEGVLVAGPWLETGSPAGYEHALQVLGDDGVGGPEDQDALALAAPLGREGRR